MFVILFWALIYLPADQNVQFILDRQQATTKLPRVGDLL
jgi:hypothetical protein